VNNLTICEFCLARIGRADIEGSKSRVAMNAWRPQASYPCGDFSVTSGSTLGTSNGARGCPHAPPAVLTKGSLGHAFTSHTLTESPSQGSFCPYALQEVSVPLELPLGHLRYDLTNVPPQPNSPPGSVLNPAQPRDQREGRVAPPRPP